MEENFSYLIKDLGFPVVMCLYFMYIHQTVIKKNTEAIQKLGTLIQVRTELKGGK